MQFTRQFSYAAKNMFNCWRAPTSVLGCLNTEGSLRKLNIAGTLGFPVSGNEIFIPTIAGDLINKCKVAEEGQLVLPLLFNNSTLVQERTVEGVFKVLNRGNLAPLAKCNVNGLIFYGTRGILTDKSAKYVYMMSGMLYNRTFHKPVADILYVDDRIFSKQDTDLIAKFIVRKLIPFCSGVYMWEDTVRSAIPVFVRIAHLSDFFLPNTMPTMHNDETIRHFLLDNVDTIINQISSQE